MTLYAAKHYGRKKEYLQEAVIFAATTTLLPRRTQSSPFLKTAGAPRYSLITIDCPLGAPRCHIKNESNKYLPDDISAAGSHFLLRSLGSIFHVVF